MRVGLPESSDVDHDHHNHTNVDNKSTSSTAYPLKVSANGRYLVDRDDVPFLMIGDSPQALTVNLSEAEADAFFADRQAAGFNLVWVNLLCATYTGGRADGSTYDGIVPFTTPNDLATPNDAFFTRVDHMLNPAAAHGLVVLLDPSGTGSSSSSSSWRAPCRPGARWCLVAQSDQAMQCLRLLSGAGRLG